MKKSIILCILMLAGFSIVSSAELPNVLWKKMTCMLYPSVSISEDNETLVLCDYQHLKIVNLKNKELSKSIRYDGRLENYAFLINNHEILINNGICYNFENNTSRRLLDSATNWFLNNVIPSSTKKFVGSTIKDTICIFDLSTEKIKKKFQIDFNKFTFADDYFSDICFTPNDKFLIAISRYGMAFAWDIEKGEFIRSFIPLGSLSNYGDNFFIESLSDSTIIGGLGGYDVWNFLTGEKKYELNINESVNSITISKDKRFLYGRASGFFPLFDVSFIYDILKDTIISSYVGTNYYPKEKFGVGFLNGTDKIIMNTGYITSIYNFAKDTFEDYITMNDPEKIVFSPDSNFIYSISIGGSFVKLDATNGRVLNIQPPIDSLNSFLLSKDCRYLAGFQNINSNTSSLLKIYDIKNQNMIFKKILDIAPGLRDRSIMKFSDNSEYFAYLLPYSMTNDYTRFFVYNIDKNIIIESDKFKIVPKNDIYFDFSPNSEKILIAEYNYNQTSQDSTFLKVWDLKSNVITCGRNLRGIDWLLQVFKFYKDNVSIAGELNGYSQTINIYNPCNYDPIKSIRLFNDEDISEFCFSPDYKNMFISTNIRDNYNYIIGFRLNVWDVTTQKKVKEYVLPYQIRPLNITFSYDGKYFTMSDDDFLYLYKTEDFLGVQERTSRSNEELIIFPNPSYSGHEITLQIPGNISGLKISLYNSLGSLLDTHVENNVSPGQHTINYKPGVELSSGTYWLRVETGRESWCKPVVIIDN